MRQSRVWPPHPSSDGVRFSKAFQYLEGDEKNGIFINRKKAKEYFCRAGWDDIVTDNMFVICNTPMAVGITRRTLFGFRQVEKKANIKNEKLIERAINNQGELVKELKSVGFWKGNTSSL